MAKGTSVRVRGRGRALELIVDGASPLSVVKHDLRQYLDSTRGLFAGFSIILNLGQRLTNSPEVQELLKLLEDEYRIKASGLWADARPREHEPIKPGLAQQNRQHLERPAPHPPELPENVETEEAALVRATCRAGTAIRHHGNVVVLGNVNPGAEIVAGGHIIVFGVLQGVAHAGAQGNREAVIIANSMLASQLRIAGNVGIRSVDFHRQHSTRPQIAYLSGDSIVMERYWGIIPELLPQGVGEEMEATTV